MSKWYDVYVERMNDRYREHVAKRYAPFISSVLEEIRPGDVVTEVGCGGTGITCCGNRKCRTCSWVRAMAQKEGGPS